MDKQVARENAFLLLFEQVSRPDADPKELLENAKACREESFGNYAETVFFGINEHFDEIEGVILKNLVGWNEKRVSVASRAVLRLATYELLFREEIPAKVSINEAVLLSKKYDDEKSYSFVNGVLHAIAKEVGRV